MSTDKYILDADGKPQCCDDLMAWARWFETANLHVAETHFGDVRVSTVFLGLDHSFGSGPPLLFKSMVFGGTLDGEQERYTSRADAEAGHTALCQRVRESMVTR